MQTFKHRGFEGQLLTGDDAGFGGTLPSYDYLALLEREGRTAEADAIVAPLASSFFAWDKNPAAYEKARSVLARLIVAGRARDL